MFTLFQLCELMFAIGGLVLGGRIGFQHSGILGCLGGGILGMIGGYLIGHIPSVLGSWFAFFHYRCRSTEKLREDLNGPVWPQYHLVFSELVRRKEDISQDFEVVLAMLVDEYNVKRIHGSMILKRCFPDLAKKVPEYDPYESLESCKNKLLEAGLIKR